MFKKLMNAIRTWFDGPPHTVVTTDDLYKKYVELLYEVRKAKDLLDFLDAKQRIQSFQQLAIEHGHYRWASPYVKQLVSVLRLKYNSWKKTRG